MPIHPLRLLIPWVMVLAEMSPVSGDDPAASPGRVSSGSARSFRSEAVVSDSAIASEVGAAILARGGNAVDAAVATAFALAVVHPAAGNIGGGGFALVRLASGEVRFFDFREVAPLDAGPDMFLDDSGTYSASRHHSGGLSVGVPGSVAGLALLHERLGRLRWADILEPAERLAREGFAVSPALARSLEEAIPEFRPHAASLAQFTRGGAPLRAGEALAQPDLASTLGRIRLEGARGFYAGRTAELLVAEVRRKGGLIQREDLEGYRALERECVRGTYRGYEILSAPPPSSGGVALIEILNILEAWPLGEDWLRGSRGIHLTIEAMRRAYCDRARALGDPGATPVPVTELTSKDYAAELRRSISPLRASRSAAESFEWPRESEQTTHLSVLDRDLNAVSLTTTLEDSWGSGIVVEGAGFLLNNEMGDFNAAPGLTTREGLIGTPPNLAAPGKRMLSSMTPTIVLRDAKPVLVLGSPGGRTIINSVLQVVLAVIDQGLPISEAVKRPRFHHQWLPDRVLAESGCFGPDLWCALEDMGHEIAMRKTPQGSVMALAVGTEAGGEPRIEAGVDPRMKDGGAAGR